MYRGFRKYYKRSNKPNGQRYFSMKKVSVPIQRRTIFNNKKPKQGIPQQMPVKLVTVSEVDATIASSVKSYSLKCNSLFDPMGDASAEQPNGFDQLAALYGSYIVTKGFLELNILNNNNFPIHVYCYTSNDAIDASVDNALSQAGAKQVVVPGLNGGGAGKLFVPFNMAIIQGRRIMKNTGDSALVSADPTSISYLHVTIKGSANLAATTDCVFKLTQQGYMYDRVKVVDA